MQVYQELRIQKEWLKSRNWPPTESFEVISTAFNEVWQLTNRLENNLNTLLAKSKILTLVSEVQQELNNYEKNFCLVHPFNQSSLADTADKLIKVIDILLKTDKATSKPELEFYNK